ncbi:TPA: diaminopimelate decarboxylase [Streptococcus pneumoniae]
MKTPFINREELEAIVAEFPTPFHLYDEKGIREKARAVNQAFSWNKGFKEYFAVKATPTPAILKILQEEGCGVDCSSYVELLMSHKLDFLGSEIMFSSNNTPDKEYAYARELGATINLDAFEDIEHLERVAGIPEIISCRYNPGGVFELGTDIMDNPGEAKFGMTKDQLFELAVEIKEKLGISLDFINLSGGIGVNYRPDQEPNDIALIGEGVRKVYEEVLTSAGLGQVKIFTELGRFMLAPHGALVTRVTHKKETYRTYLGVDASAVNLIRPAMYGAYHHISNVTHPDGPAEAVDVVGSLCENNDKFAVNRELPHTEIGDLLVIHDTGAHGFSMGYQYNAKLRSAEILYTEEGKARQIRRAERPEDYFATLYGFDFEE